VFGIADYGAERELQQFCGFDFKHVGKLPDDLHAGVKLPLLCAS
jgi:hypothetical protein